MLLALFLALSQTDSPTSCIDGLRRIGHFDHWRGSDQAGWSAPGWQRVSQGNGVVPSVRGYRGNYGAGFQTVYGPGSLTTHAVLPGTAYTLSAWIGGEAARTVSIRLIDEASGRYLNSAGSWQDTPADAIIQPSQPAVVARPFVAEGAGHTFRVELRSAQFGTCQGLLCYCEPLLCPTGWIDEVTICGEE